VKRESFRREKLLKGGSRREKPERPVKPKRAKAPDPD
jgi:hypothetical protein